MKYSDFSGRKVLIAGASGFLGSHLCRWLCDANAQVFAVSRTPRAATAGNMQWIRADLSNVEAVEGMLKAIRPDVVFHLTTHGVGAPDMALVLPTFHNDLLATVNMLTVATKVGCSRMVLAASLEEPMPLQGEPVPSSPYAAAKWAAGAYARMFQRLYGTPVVLTRPYMTYGPGQRDHKLIPYVILSLLKDQQPKLASGLRAVDWIYVDDVIEGLLAAAQAQGVEGCTIDLGSGRLVSIRDVVEQVAKLIGGPVSPLFGVLNDRPVEQVRVADMEYAAAKLGWAPKIDLEAGLKHTVKWYQEQTLLTK